ncbi:MAG: hypothetical protein AAFO06_08035 [Cyanobacteria bacterium J06597_16]
MNELVEIDPLSVENSVGRSHYWSPGRSHWRKSILVFAFLLYNPKA